MFTFVLIDLLLDNFMAIALWFIGTLRLCGNYGLWKLVSQGVLTTSLCISVIYCNCDY